MPIELTKHLPRSYVSSLFILYLLSLSLESRDINSKIFNNYKNVPLPLYQSVWLYYNEVMFGTAFLASQRYSSATEMGDSRPRADTRIPTRTQSVGDARITLSAKHNNR